MGDGKGSGAEMGFLPRLLIILFGIGIVLLGLEPIQRRYGSVWQYLSLNAGTFPGSEFVANTWESLKTAGRDFRTQVEMAQQRRPEERNNSVVEAEKKPKNVDQLSERDRRELDDLLHKPK